MSTGVFLSIQESFIDTARDRALELVACIERALATSGQPALHDHAEGPHVCTGRTGLDHIGSSSLVSLGKALDRARRADQPRGMTRRVEFGRDPDRPCGGSAVAMTRSDSQMGVRLGAEEASAGPGPVDPTSG